MHVPNGVFRRLSGALASFLGAALLAGTAWGQAPLAEQQLKASMVLNFARYATWPASVFATADAPLVFCMIGRDAGGMSLADLAGRTVGNRQAAVRGEVQAENAQGCHVIYIADSENRRLASILQALRPRPVLTISDIEGFIDLGGSIGLVAGQSRLQFEINRAALAEHQLKASSQLLRLARNLAK